MSRTLLLSTLLEKDACEQQVMLFRKKFGESVEVTPELCAAVATEFDFSWAADNLLSQSARADYKSFITAAWADYKRFIAPALDDFERVKTAAWADYKSFITPAWADYERVMASAWADYERVKAAAWVDYKRAVAVAFALAYIADTVQS